MGERGDPLPNRINHGEELLVLREYQLARGIIEDVRRGRRSEGMVERNDHCAELEGRQVGHRPLGTMVGEDRDPVPFGDAEALKGCGRPLDAVR